MSAHRCGRVVFLGRANTGKSTLLNRLLGCKLAATCSKPQTTRRTLLGIRTAPGWQAACLDTPGLQLRRGGNLNRGLRRATERAATDADLALLVCVGRCWGSEEKLLLEWIRHHRRPAILVLNKIDRMRDKRDLLPLLRDLATRHVFLECVPLSARTGENLESLERCLARHLPLGPARFPPGRHSDRDGGFFAEEFLREQLSRRLGRELPYRLAVTVERQQEDDRCLALELQVWVEKEGQKRIAVGSGARVLKESSTRARLELQRLLGKRVYLRAWVKVVPGWTRETRKLQQLGLPVC